VAGEPEGFGVRRDHAGPGIDLEPAHAEFAPVFKVGVGEADGGEGVAGPGVGLGEVGGAGKAGADAVIEGFGEVHDLAVLEAFVADALVHGEVEGFGGGLGSVVGRDGLRFLVLVLLFVLRGGGEGGGGEDGQESCGGGVTQEGARQQGTSELRHGRDSSEGDAGWEKPDGVRIRWRGGIRLGNVVRRMSSCGAWGLC
jgi:hypothetical protein